jgi:hypothetical protein
MEDYVPDIGDQCEFDGKLYSYTAEGWTAIAVSDTPHRSPMSPPNTHPTQDSSASHPVLTDTDGESNLAD